MRNKLVESACFSLASWIDNSCSRMNKRLKTARGERDYWRRQCRFHMNRILGMSEHIEALEEELEKERNNAGQR